MLDFVFISLIFLEIFLTCFLVKKILKFEKQINLINLIMLKKAKIFFEALQNFKKTISRINKIVSFITNEKFIKIRKISAFLISTVQIIILLKSVDFSKGLKSINYKNMKKILFTQAAKELIRNILKNLENLAAV